MHHAHAHARARHRISCLSTVLALETIGCSKAPGVAQETKGCHIPNDGSDGGMGDGAMPPACGSLAVTAEGYGRSGSLHGEAWTSVSVGTTIAPVTFAHLPANSPLCVQGSVVTAPTGYAWAILGLDVNGVLRTDGGDASADAGGPTEEVNAMTPTTDGITADVSNNAGSTLWLCLGGADEKQWCVTDLADEGPFFPWTSFLDENGSGAVYDGAPILWIGLVVPDPGPAGSASFDFCLNGLAEASWCACGPDGVSCPLDTSECNATCVPNVSTNPNDCGRCGTACSATSACSAGTCSDTLVSGQNDPTALAGDGTNLYFVDPIAGTIMSVGTGGGAPVALATGQTYPLAIGIKEATVYWANGGTSENNFTDGALMKVARTGGAPILLASGQSGIEAIALDETSVYWANAGTLANNYTDGSIMKVAQDGGAAITLASGQTAPVAIAVDGTTVYWANEGSSGPGTLADDGAIMALPLNGGTPVTLASAQPGPGTIAVDAASVYWTTTGSVAKVPLGGGNPIILATEQSQPFAIALDGANVYWTNWYAGSVAKVPLGGGDPVTLAAGQNHALGIVVDGANVFWTANDGAVAGGILHVLK